jgi:hypothetical protein
LNTPLKVSALQDVQGQFQDYILGAAPGIEAAVIGNARADAQTRLQVYADAYRLRLLEALGNDYEALRQFAGAAQFESMGRAYIEAHPSDTASVRWFGRHLPQFLHTAPGYAARPVLYELALFEWKKGEVFDAPEAAAVAIEAVAAVPPESWAEMRLLPHPALRRLDLRWNVPAICQAYEAQTQAPRARARPQARPWLLWRDEALDIRWRPLTADEAAAIDAVCAGRSFGELCERLCEWVEPEQAAMHAAGLLKRWIVDRLIVEIEIAGPA